MSERADHRPRKHSVTLRGHRTSVSLEDAFWDELNAIAADRGVSVNALVAEIDEARGLTSGLASAIRVYVLEQAKAR
ncbi:aryl-sulfate sulfotransferase [Rhodobacterales bacterium HKCCE3408]|nr:aryl-sulfate sulfotransferase [Rhodobacterales bacterium HKCCE3408]